MPVSVYPDVFERTEIYLKQLTGNLIPEEGLLVKDKEVLIIEKGCQVVMLGMIVVAAGGSIQAVGTEDEPIVFLPGMSKKSQATTGIVFYGGATDGTNTIIHGGFVPTELGATEFHLDEDGVCRAPLLGWPTDNAETTLADSKWNKSNCSPNNNHTRMEWCVFDRLGYGPSNPNKFVKPNPNEPFLYVDSLALFNMDNRHIFTNLCFVKPQNNGLQIYGGCVNFTNVVIVDPVRNGVDTDSVNLDNKRPGGTYLCGENVLAPDSMICGHNGKITNLTFKITCAGISESAYRVIEGMDNYRSLIETGNLSHTTTQFINVKFVDENGQYIYGTIEDSDMPNDQQTPVTVFTFKKEEGEVAGTKNGSKCYFNDTLQMLPTDFLPCINTDEAKAELSKTVAYYYTTYCASADKRTPDEWHVKWWVERICDPTQTLYTVDYMKQVFINRGNCPETQALLESS